MSSTFAKQANSKTLRGGEWYLEKRGSRKILAGSRNLGSVFDKSRSLVFAWFVFTFFESPNFLPKSLGLGFLTRISASRRVSDFTIRHPYSGQKTHRLSKARSIVTTCISTKHQTRILLKSYKKLGNSYHRLKTTSKFYKETRLRRKVKPPVSDFDRHI